MLQHVITQNDGELTVSVDTGAVSGTASQGFYVTSDGAVEVALDGTITHYINGLPFDANGRLVISTDTVFAYSNGIPVTSTGAVALSADAATYYNNGIPFAGGAIAAAGLYGPELVTNGGFDSDITDWTDTSEAPGSATWSAGQLLLQNPNSSPAEEGKVSQSFTTVPSKTYRLVISDRSGSNSIVQVGSTGDGSSDYYQSGNGTGAVNETFEATGTTTTITIRNFNHGLHDGALIDNVSVREVL